MQEFIEEKRNNILTGEKVSVRNLRNDNSVTISAEVKGSNKNSC